MASEDKFKGWDYLDFELELSKVSGSDYSVSVIHSPAGEAKEVISFPFGELELDNSLKDLKIALLHARDSHRKVFSKEECAVQDFGKILFDFLVSKEVRSLYDVSKREAAVQEKGLRLKLRIQPPELAALPWEFLYDSRQAEYICLSRDTPVVRYLDLPQPILPLEVARPLRILGMVASPSDLPQLNAEIEKQRVQEALKRLIDKSSVEITWLEGQTWRDLQTAMLKGPWNIFHFIGHGGFDSNKDEGIIALADENGKASYMNATKLGRLLADHKSLRLAVLNSCEGAYGSDNDIFSSTAAILVRRGIPAVLAMQYEITDRAAIEFARTFYESLSEGLPIDASVAEGRKAVDQSISLTLEWGVPVLYMRAPDGILFNFDKEQTAKESPKISEELKGSPSLAGQTLVAEKDASIQVKEQTIQKSMPIPSAPTIKSEESIKGLGEVIARIIKLSKLKAIIVISLYLIMSLLIFGTHSQFLFFPGNIIIWWVFTIFYLIIFSIISDLSTGRDSWINEAKSLMFQDRYGEAIKVYDSLIQQSPQDLEIWHLKGDALYYQGSYDEAIKSYDRVLRPELGRGKYEHCAEVWQQKYNAFKALGREIEAKAALDEANKLGYQLV